MNYKNLNNILGWIVFAIALFVYTATMEDTVSLWDCGEYISTAYKLEVGHPPGAPLFNMLGRIFSAFVSTHNVAWSINFMSGLVSAFTILFLFWSITHLAKKMATSKGSNVSDQGTMLAVLGAGAIGALAYTFSDSFWFSAVEGEVYAMSSFFTAAVVWAMFKWEEVADEVGADRWIILIFFLIGLSIGVHLLNLLAIPAMTYIYYFRKCKQSTGGFIFTGIFGIMILAIIQAIIVPKIPDRMANFEMLFTNSLGMPFGLGTGIFLAVLIGTIVLALYAMSQNENKMLHNVAYLVLTLTYGLIAGGIIWALIIVVVYLIISLFTQNNFLRFIVTNLGILLGWIMWEIFFKKEQDQEAFNARMRRGVKVGILSFTTLLIGYSCFLMIIIRSNANTPIDENNPENPISFLSYLNREQYGSWPIVYGPYWNSAVDVYNEDGVDGGGYTIDGEPIYMRGFAVKRDGNLIQGFRTEKEAKEYIKAKNLTGVDINEEYFISDDRKGIDYRFKSKHMTFFPRMFSREERHVHGYKLYSGYDPTPDPDRESFTDPLTGRTEVLPTFGNNLKFFFNYQVGWMYWRYFLWNFAGRQNDEQGIGPGPLEGNWISGINFIDKQHVGDQSKVPASITRNRAYNKFFMLPLILGLIGFVFTFFYARADWFVILLLFLFTGLMIIIYLNAKPYEPRERDYAYAGSFYAFAFWIGLGVWALYDMAKRVNFKQLGIAGAVTAALTLMILAIDSGSGQGFTFSFSMVYILIVSMVMCGIMIFMGSNNSGSTVIATVAILISVPVPILMGTEGWNDHDRSDRTTALDFASNFLETCEKNAIIFTHGDNDTFPLWYAQEVEGIRTDVRVVNLSLLGTDWYIDQMVRKAYESDPVPFTAPEYMYRQGGLLDYVQLDASKNTKGVYLDLVQAMTYVMNDDNVTVGDGGRKFMSIPSRTFSLKVDPKLIEQYKVIDKSEFNKMVAEIQFTVPKTSLYKNDLMILDLLAHNNWKRPIYFAGGADTKTYLGLQNYFSSEGLAYKFVPIETKSNNPNAFGKVNIERMYHNIMNVYKWGGMDKKGCNVDYYIRRTMTNNYRLMFYTLAQELASQGDKSERMEKMANANIKMIEDTMAKGFGNKAVLEEQIAKMKETVKKEGANKTKMYDMCKKVVDKCLKVMPEANVPYDRIIPSFVPILYQIGEKEKAREIINILVKQEYDNFSYYTSLAPRFCVGTMESAQVSFRIIGMLEQVARDAKDTQTADMVRAKEDGVAMQLNEWIRTCIEENQEYASSFAEYFPQLFQQAPQMPPMTPAKPH